MTQTDLELVDRLAVGVHALRRCGYVYGENVFVSKGTPLGLAVAVEAKTFGAARVAVGCQTAEEQMLTSSLGLEPWVRERESETELLHRLTDDRGFAFAFETSGTEAGYAAILALVKRGAVVGVLTELPQPYSFFVKTAIRSQIRFIGVHSFDEADKRLAQSVLSKMKKG